MGRIMRSRKSLGGVALLCAAVAIVGFVAGVLVQWQFGSSANLSVRPDSAASEAAHHLVRILKSDGTFVYEIDLVSGKTSRDNNLVRQAGTGYGLAEYFAHSRDDTVESALESTIDAMWSYSIPVADGALVSADDSTDGIKAGSTALALLAALHFEEATASERFREQRTAWLKGLLSLVRPGAGFRRNPDSDRESPYYNGEGWLALAVFASQHPGEIDTAVLEALDKYLMDRYGPKLDKGFFHWGVMAAAQRFRTTGNRQFLRFAVDQAEQYLQSVPYVHPELNSCYVVEGLAAVAAILDDAPVAGDLEIRNRLIDRVDREMDKNRGFQNQSPWIELEGALLRSNTIARHKGAFRNGMYRMKARIDFTQHCLSALVKQAQM